MSEQIQVVEEASIYTLNDGDKPFYIGKTVVNEKGKINLSDLNVYYQNRKLNKRVNSAKKLRVKIIFKTSNEPKVWFNDKLNKHKKMIAKKHKLVNSKKTFGLWHANYWLGKKRDKNTLKRLSESKFVPIVQYNLDGTFVKRWPSGRHAAKHYRIYVLENGRGYSKIHMACGKKGAHIWKNWVWYKESQLIDIYGKVPDKLHRLEYEVPTKKVKYFITKNNANGKMIDYYYTLSKAATANNLTEYFIKQNLNKNQKFGGFYWKTIPVSRL